MQYNLDDIRALSEILECEANGQPFDRDNARLLAGKLGEIHPSISKSMRLLLSRLDDDPQLARCA